MEGAELSGCAQCLLIAISLWYMDLFHCPERLTLHAGICWYFCSHLLATLKVLLKDTFISTESSLIPILGWGKGKSYVHPRGVVGRIQMFSQFTQEAQDNYWDYTGNQCCYYSLTAPLSRQYGKFCWAALLSGKFDKSSLHSSIPKSLYKILL